MNTTKKETQIEIHHDLVGGGYIELGNYIETGEKCIRYSYSAFEYKEVRNKLKNYFEYFNHKEHYYVTAINNLYRQTNFLELFQQLSEKQINEDEFNKELETYPEKYTISIEDKADNEVEVDIPIILDIFNNINSNVKELSVSEVGELFSIDSCKLFNYTTRFVEERALLTP